MFEQSRRHSLGSALSTDSSKGKSSGILTLANGLPYVPSNLLTRTVSGQADLRSDGFVTYYEAFYQTQNLGPGHGLGKIGPLGLSKIVGSDEHEAGFLRRKMTTYFKAGGMVMDPLDMGHHRGSGDMGMPGAVHTPIGRRGRYGHARSGAHADW